MIRDPNTEQYAEAWTVTRPGVDVAYDNELRSLLSPTVAAHRSRLRSDSEEATGYALLTELLFRIEDRLHELLRGHTADTLILGMRRHIVLDLLHTPEHTTLDLWRTRQHGFVRAVQLFARPGTAALPQGGGTHQLPVTPQLVADVDLAAKLCSVYRLIQGERAVLATGEARLDFVDDLVPVAVRSDATTELEHPGGDERVANNLLARVGGLATPLPNIERIPFDGVDPGTLIVCGWVPVGATHVAEAEAASDVRLFQAQLFDGREILGFLRYLDERLVAAWGVNALELTATLAAISQLPFRLAEGGESRALLAAYATEARAVFTSVKAPFLEWLAALVPDSVDALDPTAPKPDVEALMERMWPVLTSVPGGPAAPRRPLVDAGTPCVLDLGDDLLVDQQGLGAGLNTLLDNTSFMGAGEKGTWFEDAVRHWLMSRLGEVEWVPNMETELVADGRVVGEADVVVRSGDTAFLVECKSRRARRMGACISHEEASSLLQPYLKWADQARRTAAAFARMPTGKGPEVPHGVDWLVPLVCTPHLDLIPPDPRAWLGPDAPIIMTPAQIAGFIHSGRWGDPESPVERYPVQHR